MKQTNFLSMIFLLIGICVFISCSKEEVQNFRTKTDISTNVEGRSITPSECGYINELCKPCKLRKASIAVAFRMVGPGGDEFLVTPEEIFEGSRDFRIQSETGQYILSNSNNDYIRSRADSIEIPPGLINILRTSETVLSESTISDSQIQTELDVPIFRNDSNEIVVNIGDFETIDNDSTYFLINDCRGQELKVMESYYKHLNEPFEVFSEATASVWMSNVDFYFEKCAEGVDLDYDCFDSRCIVGSLLDAFENSWSDSQVKNLKLNYLSLLLNLDEDETEALGNADIELINELYTISECGQTNFCPILNDSNDKVEEILKETIFNSVGGDPITLEEFQDNLNENDWIILDESFSGNEKVDCIWQTLMVSDNELMCTTLSNFFGGRFNLYLYVQDFGVSTANGFTDFLDNGGFSISLNEEYVKDACPVEILRTILHEAVHAEILRRQRAYTIAELNQLYPEMMIFFNDPSISDAHHEYMGVEWYDLLLEAVVNFYPGLTIEEYKLLAWGGLHKTEAFSNSGYTNDDLKDMREELRKNCDKSCD